ncbi:MAG: formylglycine-generating enzyme family protein [Verrucomicrobia bacterium]|nr:formylglycine-generating enzyme family protein [Verrucomicrobiota bacterium]
MPARRAPSPGHGAMAHWTPDGWTTVLGPHFYFCSHINGMKPMEFLLLSQAQEDPEGFKQALMCEWLGKALGEAAPSNYGSSGGFWPLLGLYRKQAIVEDEKIKDIGATGEELAESDVSTEKEEIEQIEVPEKFRKITVAEDGTITIPVGACKSPKSGEKIRFMESVDGGMQAHYRLKGPRPELFSYSIYLPKAGKYELTAHVCTVTVDRQALLRVNRRTLLDFDIPYTKADWMDTEPVELDLKEGRNRIGYTHYSPNTGVSIKHFTLKPVKRVGGTSGLSARSGGAGQNEIANMIGVRMARIAPGSFMMGSTTGPGTERPAHRVTLSKGFYMGVTEVTQGQWESVMPENPSRFKGSDRPVENVVLKDCVEFCKRLTQKERAQGKLPEGAEYRLPTEAEWEYACRAGSEARYGFGNSETDLGEYAWYRENSVRTQPVGMKKANAWGLFDMHGNVWEWCSDWNGSYSADDAVDPTGAPAGASYGHRVFRGGSWGSTAAHCRSATRNGCGTNNSRLSGLGFRLVRTLPGQSSCVIAYQLKDTVMNSAHKLPQENQQVLRFSTEDGGEGTRVVETVWQADRFNSLFKILCKRVLGDSQKIRPDGRPYEREGRIIDPNPTWLRDHIHEMKAYQYLKKDITSFVDEIITLQHADGFYYEILGNAGYWHQWCVDKKHFLREDDKDLCWIRLEMEADIEYLMVEAAHRIWQATGDFEAMKRRLPSLERGLEYNFTDPTRWNAEHGALMRTFSIDTWDFTYGVQNDNRKIRPHFPMGIMHGDNSGLYRACLQLSEMLTAAGNTERAAFWRKRGEALRERINKLCFNGNYYTHQILLQPVDTGVKEEDILSLSNTYDINRGLPTHAMAVKIIDEYQRRRAAKRETHFAEWFSVDPPYPKFGRFKAGEYINGGICGLVAGELSKAAFHHGREAYAADILDRVDKLVARDGFLSFLYDNSGKNQEGGPRGWPAAAVISAMVEGLAGIRDEATLFQTVTVAPRFTAAGMNQAYVCLKYGPSDAWVAMDYRREGNSIALQLGGNPDLYHVKILLPKGVKNAKAADAATAAVFTGIETIEESHYATLDIPAAKKKGEGVACKIEWIEGRRD